MNLRRVARVAERIREEASNIILYELTDPRIQFVTITKVDLSKDLRHAKIYVSVLGDEAKQRTTLRGLASARGLVQSRIGKSLGIRDTPLITFEFDPTIASAIEISRLIDQARAESPAPSDEAAPDADASGAESPGDDAPSDG